ncbi:conserved hypothetical protein [Tolumonas auensis DSM 9187]|uniref:AB hydrolase-1 domain-containing protein n=1 Tax=Tolumonas auensis (strain DSM 9187 / NBRC 110442 / TA 4) TaxID=595494 RepID=C4LEC3_TOLAT|nr:alpha/beta fold hydrolase [Tolumonas auensis]ACQ92940.1 conserved hypothetical protein [Tolumonas auensis DSM 9187]
MQTIRTKQFSTLMIAMVMAIAVSGCTSQSAGVKPETLSIEKQGSFAVGGTIVQTPGTFDPIKQGAYSPMGVDSTGQTLHGDHATVFYQIPPKAHHLPLVFWHGHGESMRTWQTTPDGREGFQNIFLKKGYATYLVDQPRRGLSGKSTQPAAISAAADEQLWFGIFRLGAWPDYYPNVQFSKDPEALNQFYRQMTPNTGPYDASLNIAAMSKLFDKMGDGILVTHSQSGGPGWKTAIKDSRVKAVVSYEPGGDFIFPEGQGPDNITLKGRSFPLPKVPMAEFKKLTEIPIVIYYGDNIPESESNNPGQEQWRVFLNIAEQFRDVVNANGGDVTLVHLPDIGVYGNTHFPMSDLNNEKIADLLSQWLKDKHLQ